MNKITIAMTRLSRLFFSNIYSETRNDNFKMTTLAAKEVFAGKVANISSKNFGSTECNE